MDLFTKVTTILVALIAIVYAIFSHYPVPPVSPIMYQWKTWGSFLTHKKFNIFYIDKQINNGTKTLVCLHGFPTSSFDYFKAYPYLIKSFDRIIFIDFLGMGYSDKPTGHSYSIMEQADIVQAVLNHIKVDAFHLLAHDYGDTVTQELLARIKEDGLQLPIKSVSLMNGGIFPAIHSPLLIQRLLHLPVIGFFLGKLNNKYTFAINLNRVFGSGTSPTMAEFYDFWAIVRQNHGYRVFGEILSYLDERYEHEDRWVSATKNTKIPLQFIYGPADPVNPAPFEEMYHKLIPNQYFDKLDDNIGHYPHFEAPEEVVKRLNQFLKKKGF
ncbi:mesoderm-specific transcript protein [Tetranychus urticae]|uniref:AB hydrolase-1 domain-containing protein n=1 Tax=Tetranychus urticae TaxID=32264 RepID=T1JUT1_TETUR|nr:mesoderm-specific transcript protein [Tetranychus urticae]